MFSNSIFNIVHRIKISQCLSCTRHPQNTDVDIARRSEPRIIDNHGEFLAVSEASHVPATCKNKISLSRNALEMRRVLRDNVSLFSSDLL